MSMLQVEPPPPYSASRPPSYIEVEQPRFPASPGLPRMHYAPGFRPRPTNPFSSHNYASTNWSSMHRNPVRKQYENVARRRLQSAPNTESLFSSLVVVVTPDQQKDTESETDSSTTSSPALSPSPTRHTTLPSVQEASGSQSPPPSPANPHEDPELVGPLAAERNKRARLYREMISQDSSRAMETESRSWDFLLAQSHDWEDRQRSWDAFRLSRQSRIGIGRKALLRSRR